MAEGLGSGLPGTPPLKSGHGCRQTSAQNVIRISSIAGDYLGLFFVGQRG